MKRKGIASLATITGLCILLTTNNVQAADIAATSADVAATSVSPMAEDSTPVDPQTFVLPSKDPLDFYFSVYAKNKTINFTWRAMEGAVKYRYQIIDLKTGKAVKSARTSTLKGFLPAKTNKSKASYMLIITGLNKSNQAIKNLVWSTYFHVEDAVVMPEAEFNGAGITMSEKNKIKFNKNGVDRALDDESSDTEYTYDPITGEMSILE